VREPVDPGPETQPSLEARPDPLEPPVREPVDPGPETQPSLEARPDPLEPPTVHPEPKPPPEPVRTAVEPAETAEPQAPPKEAPSEPLPAPAQPVVVRGQYHYLTRWTFVLVLVGVWIPAALIGVALYYYWFHAPHKTPAVFAVLMFIVVCTLGAQLLAMVEHKPLVTAVSIALLASPFAATAAAAALYGAYASHWIHR
jgi:hypothetical protein